MEDYQQSESLPVSESTTFGLSMKLILLAMPIWHRTPQKNRPKANSVGEHTFCTQMPEHIKFLNRIVNNFEDVCSGSDELLELRLSLVETL